MIYTVECALGVEQTDADWERWDASMKPPADLLAVPGFLTAQRFKGVGQNPPPYFALYSVTSGEVLSGGAYRGTGGGNFRTEDWRPLITFWHRNLFAGADRAPAIPETAYLAVLDCDAPAPTPGPVTWLTSAGLDATTKHRAIAAVQPGLAKPWTDAGFKLYRPRTPQLTSTT